MQLITPKALWLSLILSGARSSEDRVTVGASPHGQMHAHMRSYGVRVSDMGGFMASTHRGAHSATRFMDSARAWLHRWSGIENVPHANSSVAHAADAFSVNGHLRVLVVDDNPSHLQMASDALEQCGVSALVASDGAEAVQLACECRFDIILMDLQMPVMDGLNATSTIRRFEETHFQSRTPVIAFSTAEVSGALITASGMDDRLSKPCSTAELEVCLLRWCDSFRPLPT